MWKSIVLLLVVLCVGPMLGAAAFCQSITISGSVVDSETGLPIPDVNVFISNTLLGAATNPDGHYSIKGVPLGRHELIASIIGYRAQKFKIKLTSPADRKFNFKLKPQVLEIPALQITAEADKEWKKNYEKFVKLFLGSSQNAKECEILNREVLDFTEASKSAPFAALAQAPLVIENRALGYRLHYLLKVFEARGEEVSYLGDVKFEALRPQSAKERRKWQRNRVEAYNGSLRHFLNSLYANRHRQAGFLAEFVPNIYAEKFSPFRAEVKRLDLFSSGELPNERYLNFDDLIEVIYYKEKEEKEYIDYRITNDVTLRGADPDKILRASDAQDQKSWLALKRVDVGIDTLGQVLEPLSVQTFGYWAWQRVADLLPKDYQPPRDLQPKSQLAAQLRNYYGDGMKQLESGDWEKALKTWVDGKRKLEEFGKTDTRIGLAFIEVVTDLHAPIYYEKASELYYWAFSGDSPLEFKKAVEQEIEFISPLLPESEFKEWKKELKKGKPDLFRRIQRFWIERDPTPTTVLNERLIEHWERIAYARKNFEKGTHTIYGTDDRGLIYVKYGKPDKEMTQVLGNNESELMRWMAEATMDAQVGQGSSSTIADPNAATGISIGGTEGGVPPGAGRDAQVAQVRRGIGNFNYFPEVEIWAYISLDSDETVLFMFGPKEGHGAFRMITSIEELIPPEAFSKRSSIYALGMLPGGLLQLMYYADLVTFDRSFADRYSELESLWVESIHTSMRPSGGQVGPNHNLLRGKRQTYLSFDKHDPLRTYAPPDYYRVERVITPLSLTSTRARILDENNRAKMLFIAFAFPPQDKKTNPVEILQGEATNDFRLRFNLTIRDSKMEALDRFSAKPLADLDNTAVFRIPHNRDQAHYTLSTVSYLDLNDSTAAASQVQDRRKVGQTFFGKAPPLDPDETKVEVSDLVIGVEPPDGFNPAVLPFPIVPTERIWKQDIVKVYLEVYHLKPAKSGLGEFTIDSRVIRLEQKGNKVKRKELVATSFDFSSRTTTAKENMGISIANFSKGPYELEVEVKDKVSGKKKKRVRRFQIME
ncbi:carboxypeptidase-like regulatory domain-containing protein [bacterium]|nr:carboxypeptidase-like regulatory domain-containing protein [bacterium]